MRKNFLKHCLTKHLQKKVLKLYNHIAERERDREREREGERERERERILLLNQSTIKTLNISQL